jgi:hypothetical protein
MAISAIDGSIRGGLEWKFCYLPSAIRAGPIALKHLPLETSASASATAIISPRSSAKFIEGQIFSPRFPDL